MTKVAICAGHGGNGSTPGKRSPVGEYEWDFNNKVVCAAVAMLKANGVDVLRLDDASGKTDVSLRTRTDRANSWGADVYVSVHHNAYQSKWGDHGGTETFTQKGNYSNAESLARKVHTRIVKAMGLHDRGLKKANLHITRETHMPAILTEGGFMDSTVDIKVMRDDDKLREQGYALAEGVLAYFGKDAKKPDKPSPKPPKDDEEDSIGTVTVKASSLWVYNKPDWDAKHTTVQNGEVFTVKRELEVDGYKMYQLISGLYITANSKYLDFSREQNPNPNPKGCSEFIRPAEGRVTSKFRSPSRRSHHGIDIAKRGTVPIKAVYDGVISRSYRSSSYGEVVFIKHVLDSGLKYETVYAHMRTGSRTVKVGDKVKQGKRIGYMGNTGYSTGQHLHWEVHSPQWTGSKKYAKNPLRYIDGCKGK